jgi:hypothetical protein
VEKGLSFPLSGRHGQACTKEGKMTALLNDEDTTAQPEHKPSRVGL